MKNVLESVYNYARSNFGVKTYGEFAAMIGVKQETLSRWMAGKQTIPEGRLIKINGIFDNVFSKDWLLTGEGSMLRNNNSENNETYENNETNDHTLPLIPIAAVAGFNGLDIPGIPLAQCPQYSIPDFIEQKAEYLIRVSGSSMYPKYSSGDILACRRIQEITFIQWGKIYVIDSQQGAMVKRLFDTRRPRTRPLPIRQPQLPPVPTPQIRNPLPLHRSRSNKAGINNTLSINQQETQDG